MPDAARLVFGICVGLALVFGAPMFAEGQPMRSWPASLDSLNALSVRGLGDKCTNHGYTTLGFDMRANV